MHQKADYPVLKILCLMSLEDVHRMTASNEVQKAISLPMAAGAEHSQWEPAPKANRPVAEPSGNVLRFPQKDPPAQAPPLNSEEFSEIDLHLQRSQFKMRDENLLKKEGARLYRQSTENHMFRAQDEKGSKLKFAHTQGVLVNKKQA